MNTPLKDGYSHAWLQELAAKTVHVFPSFSSQTFLKNVLDADWEGRGLMDRMHWIADTLFDTLGLEFEAAVDLLLQVEASMSKDSSQSGLLLLVFPDIVERFGRKHWEVSMRALEEFTKHSSAEFAIRPFLRDDWDRGLAQLLSWTRHEHEGVRRLASEGCRPRLPWASVLRELIEEPTPILPILEALQNDPSRYVRRSVANNLNDLSKDHPTLALALGKRWIGDSPETAWVVKHGLRTLLQSKHPEALALFGFSQTPPAIVKSFACSREEVEMGEDFELSATLEVRGECALRLEFEFAFLRKRGVSNKVFQWTEKTVEGGVHTFRKKFAFHELSTRRYYEGPQEVTLVVNGKPCGKRTVFLRTGKA